MKIETLQRIAHFVLGFFAGAMFVIFIWGIEIVMK